MKQVGLLGGAFDPIHNGHIRIAVEVAEALELEEVKIVPVNIPSHRAMPEASASQRCQMIASVESSPLRLDDVEIERGGVSYTVDTLEYLKKKSPNCSFSLILGEDAFLSIGNWHRASDIFSLTNFVVVSREWFGKENQQSSYASLGGKLSCNPRDLAGSVGCVYFMKTPLIQLASSEIREKRKTGRSILGLVPAQVETIILENNLYKNG